MTNEQETLEQLSDEQLEAELQADETETTTETNAETNPETDAGSGESETVETATDAEAGGTPEIPAVGEDADVSHTRQFQGLLNEAREERSKRQELERRLAELEKRPAGRAEAAETAEEEGDTLLTKAELRAYLDERDKRLQEEQRHRQFQQTVFDTEQTALRELTAETCGKGLDYTTVITQGQKHLTEYDLMAIAQAQDPARECYRRCIAQSPELQERQMEFRFAQRLARSRSAATAPPAKTDRPKASSTGAIDFDELSDEELETMLRQEE